MVTVVVTPAVVVAIRENRLPSDTIHVLQPNPPAALAERRPVRGPDSACEAELLADHVRVDFVPVVVADRAPFTVVIDLHPTLAAGRATNETDLSFCNLKPE